MGPQPGEMNDPLSPIRKPDVVDDETILASSGAPLPPESGTLAGFMPDDAARLRADQVGSTRADEPDTSVLHEGIAQTRAELSGTIDAIQDRLRPERSVAEAKERVREATIGKAEELMSNMSQTAQQTTAGIWSTIRHNPIPVALIGFGVGWLVWQSRSQENLPAGRRSSMTDRYNYQVPVYRDDEDMLAASLSDRPIGASARQGTRNGTGLGDRVGNAANTVQDRAGNLTDTVQDRVGQLSDTLQDRVGELTDNVQSRFSQLGDQVQQQAHQAQDWFQGSLQTNPLAWGAGALVLGTLVGISVPETLPEHRLMGKAHEQLADRVQVSVQDTMQKVQKVAEETKQAAKDKAREQGLTQ